MTLAADLKNALFSIRSIPGQLGLRVYSLTVSVRFNPGAFGLEGEGQVETTSVVEQGGYPPKVRFLNDEQLAIGGLPKGTVEVGPITPECTAGGNSLATLTGTSANPGELLHYTLTGPGAPNGALYRLIGVKDHRALHYTLTLAPLAST